MDYKEDLHITILSMVRASLGHN